jgi:hypothetical protein
MVMQYLGYPLHGLCLLHLQEKKVVKKLACNTSECGDAGNRNFYWKRFAGPKILQPVGFLPAPELSVAGI